MAIVKYSAHTGSTDSVSNGNMLEDSAAKQATLNPSSVVLQCASLQPPVLLPLTSLDDVAGAQSCADGCQKTWENKGCTQSPACGSTLMC